MIHDFNSFSLSVLSMNPTVSLCMWFLSSQSALHNNDFTSLLKGSLSLLPTICPPSLLLHLEWVPGLFVFLIDPFWWSQVRSEFRPMCRSQMCQVILKPHKNSADITLQIAGNYVCPSLGKYAQISSYNWSLLKIKAVWGIKIFVGVFSLKAQKCWFHEVFDFFFRGGGIQVKLFDGSNALKVIKGDKLQV